MSPLFYQRFAKPILWVTLLLLPVVVWGAALSLKSTSNRVIDWLPANFEETQRLFWFFDRFGSDEILAISWPACTLESPAVEPLTDALLQANPVAGREAPFFREAVSGQSTLKLLTSEPMNLPRDIALGKMRGWILGEDNQATCIVARVMQNEDGTFSRIAACEFVQATAEQHGISRHELRMAGPTAGSVAIDRAGSHRAHLMRLSSLVFTLALSWICLRDWRQVAAVFATATFATVASLAAVHFTGSQVDAVLLTLPALILVLVTSGAIHLTHYYNSARQNYSAEVSPGLAVHAGWLPCTLASGTTMIGLVSLAVSEVVPVARFGKFSAVGIGIGWLCLLLLWPALAQVLLTQPRRQPSPAALPWWNPVFRFSTAAKWPLLLAILVGFPLLGLGLARINTSVHLSSLLPSDSPLLESYSWFRKRIGPLVPVEVVLQFPIDESDPARAMFDRAVLVESLREQVDAIDGTRGTFAATTFVPELPQDAGARQVMLRRVLGQRIYSQRSLLEQRGLISQQYGEELWRVSTRVSSDTRDYGPFLEELNATVDNFVAEQNLQPGLQLQAKICGSVPLVQLAQRQLLLDLVKSFVVAFGLIGLAMMLLLRNPLGGLLSMIPNIFPSLLVLGYMGFRGDLVDIGTMMTGSVALGIAVDDTLHFLVWFQRHAATGKSRLDAIRAAFGRSATAMLQTTLICGFCMLPFVTSSFGPASRFTGGIITLLMAALIGDLLFLPAILASPLGRCFLPATFKPKSESNHASESVQVPTS